VSCIPFSVPFIPLILDFMAGSIGNLLGEQKAQRAGVAANTSIVMALAIAAIPRFVFVLRFCQLT